MVSQRSDLESADGYQIQAQEGKRLTLLWDLVWWCELADLAMAQERMFRSKCGSSCFRFQGPIGRSLLAKKTGALLMQSASLSDSIPSNSRGTVIVTAV